MLYPLSYEGALRVTGGRGERTKPTVAFAGHADIPGPGLGRDAGVPGQGSFVRAL